MSYSIGQRQFPNNRKLLISPHPVKVFGTCKHASAGKYSRKRPDLYNFPVFEFARCSAGSQTLEIKTRLNQAKPFHGRPKCRLRLIANMARFAQEKPGRQSLPTRKARTVRG